MASELGGVDELVLWDGTPGKRLKLPIILKMLRSFCEGFKNDGDEYLGLLELASDFQEDFQLGNNFSVDRECGR
jgi:hypothetical protein